MASDPPTLDLEAHKVAEYMAELAEIEQNRGNLTSYGGTRRLRLLYDLAPHLLAAARDLERLKIENEQIKEELRRLRNA